jgi:hypothetical protein
MHRQRGDRLVNKNVNKPTRLPVMTQRVEKEAGGKGAKANRKLPQGKTVNTARNLSREERSTAAAMRQFEQMDRKPSPSQNHNSARTSSILKTKNGKPA